MKEGDIEEWKETFKRWSQDLLVQYKYGGNKTERNCRLQRWKKSTTMLITEDTFLEFAGQSSALHRYFPWFFFSFRSLLKDLSSVSSPELTDWNPSLHFIIQSSPQSWSLSLRKVLSKIHNYTHVLVKSGLFWLYCSSSCLKLVWAETVFVWDDAGWSASPAGVN